jgi:hypothetical protein
MEALRSTFKIRFQNLSLAEANVQAARLRQQILDSSPDVSIQLEKEDSNTMDFGTTLVLVLGAPAIVTIAQGIANYLARARGRIIIEKDGRIIAEGISGGDAARIVEALSSHK